MLQETYKLIEIHKTNQYNWLFLHDFILKNNLSLEYTTKFCRSIREIDDSIKYDFIKEIINLEEIKTKVANEFLKEKETTKKSIIEIIENIQGCFEKLEDKISLGD